MIQRIHAAEEIAIRTQDLIMIPPYVFRQPAAASGNSTDRLWLAINLAGNHSLDLGVLRWLYTEAGGHQEERFLFEIAAAGPAAACFCAAWFITNP
jgi:hypothetical protein